MVTVPAHSFCAPTRAKLIAAARFMPGVWAVLVSREPAGITRTPSCFQSVMTADLGAPPRRGKRGSLERFPSTGNRARFPVLGNARADDAVSLGHIPFG